jgi:hypothetical protein
LEVAASFILSIHDSAHNLGLPNKMLMSIVVDSEGPPSINGIPGVRFSKTTTVEALLLGRNGTEAQVLEDMDITVVEEGTTVLVDMEVEDIMGEVD